jgi:hypothetical protein
MAMRDITDLMNTYRECTRNVWNVYFSKQENVGACLDAFERIRELMFESLVVNDLFQNDDAGGEDTPPLLKVVPRARSLILIRRPSNDGNFYWDQEKDMVVGPDDITLEFLDYFDFSQVPIKDFRYFRCKILRFPSRTQYEGREALIDALDQRVFHDEAADDQGTSGFGS